MLKDSALPKKEKRTVVIRAHPTLPGFSDIDLMQDGTLHRRVVVTAQDYSVVVLNWLSFGKVEKV